MPRVASQAATPRSPAANPGTPVGERLLLAVSIVAGLAYPALAGHFGTIADIVVKGLCVGALSVAAFRNSGSGFQWLGAILGFGAIGDMLLDVPGAFLFGAGSFAIGHCLAIGFYTLHRRTPAMLRDRLAAVALIGFGLAMPALVSPAGTPIGAAMLYSVLLCGMAAAALLSRFARPWAGIGALLFIVSDTFLIMRLGGTLVGGAMVHGLVVWFTYYAGQALIFVGVARGLRAGA